MDISEWKIINLHRKGNQAGFWYFMVNKPDGKRLYIDRTDRYGMVWTSKIPNSAIWTTEHHGSSELYVKAGSEAGAIRKIMRYIEALAKDWNLREEIKNEGTKQITFDGRKPNVIGTDRQLEAPKKEPVVEEPVRGRNYFRREEW